MKHVLLIEDEGIIALQLSQTIESEGDYRVSIALNGREGLEVHEEDPADLVVTDLNMPELDGFGVIESVRAKTPAVKIIVLSGASQETERRAVEMGALCTLSKPVYSEDLLTAINDAFADL
ncbi:MAG: YesN/AraC family two-component response regulator [Candidatus Latescibacterota bacterium]|jgi:YesN/AraC family two-component response regulator